MCAVSDSSTTESAALDLDVNVKGVASRESSSASSVNVNSHSVPDLTSVKKVKMSKNIKISEFATTNPNLWFLTAETIFAANEVSSEAEKFSYLLQCLQMEQLEKIQNIIENSRPHPRDGSREGNRTVQRSKSGFIGLLQRQ
jgi:hypothetical protein